MKKRKLEIILWFFYSVIVISFLYLMNYLSKKIYLENKLAFYITVGLFALVLFELTILIDQYTIRKTREITTPSLIRKIEEKKEELFESKQGIPIKISDFSKAYKERVIISGLNLIMNIGEFVSIIGPAGSGKSTLLECMVNRKKPTTGNIKFFGREYKDVKGKIAFVPQQYEIYLNQTVYQNLKNSAIKWSVKEADAKIERVLVRFGLLNYKKFKANKLSGGQMRLLSIAMELIRDPEIIILDEPTSGLDPNVRNDIVTALSNLAYYSKKTIVMSTHFMSDAKESDRIVLLARGKKIIEGNYIELVKNMPGGGIAISAIIQNINYKIYNNLKKLPRVNKIKRTGKRVLIISEKPSLNYYQNKLKMMGCVIKNAGLVNLTLDDAFFYYTR